MRQTRICASCQVAKSLDDFDTVRGGRSRVCKTCDAPRKWRVCIDCGAPKPITEFYPMHKGGEKRQARCKVCDNKRRCRIGDGNTERRGARIKLCHCCAGLAHRVEPPIAGARCFGCGLPYQAEAPVTLADVSLHPESAIARAEVFA